MRHGFILLLGLVLSLPAAASTVRLVAATPLMAYADPLALDGGNGIVPSVFDSLTKVLPDGSVGPALATAWRNESDTVWVFELRDGVSFSNGAPLTADLVVDCLRHMTTPAGRATPNAIETATIAAVRALGPRTVEITTTTPDARLPRKLSRLRIWHMPSFEKAGRSAFSRAPVGTGPYVIERWVNGEAGVVMTANPKAWRPSAEVDRVEVAIVTDATVRLQILLAGDADLAANLDPDTIAVLEGEGLSAHIQDAPVVLALALRNVDGTIAPLKDPRVRRALNMAVDRQRIVDTLLYGTMNAAGQIATPGVVGYDPALAAYPYDPDRARELLAEAGYPVGFAMTAGVFSGQIPGDTLIFQQVAQDLATIGVRLELRRLAFSDFNRRRIAGDWGDMSAFSYVWSHYQLGDISRSVEQSSCLAPAPWFCLPELMGEIEAANRALQPVERERLLKVISARLHDVAPSLLLVQYASIVGVAETVDHFELETDAIQFGKMRMRAGAP
ncbi:MAG: ABC transporter substrate-binding protein [Rhodospirillaceae bacterium]|nr:ABC transporter substrate-binding protein [Rhodospirillaceae bacterium]